MAGFKYVGTEGTEPVGKATLFDITSSHASRLSIGDVVLKTGTATAATGLAIVDVGTASAAVTGVITGFVPSYATESFSDTGLAASTAGQAYVITDPFALYEVDVSNGPFVVADVGLNCEIVATAATQYGGLTISNMTVNFTNRATTATLPFKIIGLLVGSDGVLGSRALVRVNASTSNAGSAGV